MAGEGYAEYFFLSRLMALIGYARVSAQEQTLQVQTDALTKAGCEKIFTDTVAGSAEERPGLAAALTALSSGDTLVVWKLDRLGRTLKDLIATVSGLHEQGIGFKSLTDQLDTAGGGGKSLLRCFGAFAEFERDLIKQRTRPGLAAARARGRKGGRPKSPLADEQTLAQAKRMYLNKTLPVQEILARLRLKKTTFYKYLKINAPQTSARPDGQKTLAEVRHHEKLITLRLYLQVENNSKFVRGKGKVRRQIEDWVLPQYQMEHAKNHDWEYILTIQYSDEKDLDRTIDEIIREMSSIADYRYCFIEADFYTLDGERSYPFAGYD